MARGRFQNRVDKRLCEAKTDQSDSRFERGRTFLNTKDPERELICQSRSQPVDGTILKTSPRIVKRPEDRRREIVEASRSLFLSQGYENTTMNDIMTKLKIAKGTTYHYFRSKDQLLDAVVEEMVSEYVRGVEKALNECRGGSLKKLEALLTAGRVVSPSTSAMMDALHRSDNREMHARLLAVTLIKLAPLYARVISQGCEEGVFRVEYPLECAEAMLAGIQFITDLGCHPWSRQDLERRTRAIPSLMENQLNAPKGSLNSLFKELN